MLNHKMRRSQILTLVLVAGGVLWMSAETPAMNGPASCIERAPGTQESATAGRTGVQDYADRQDTARSLEDFAGGEDVVFTQGMVIVLCVVLLIVLL